MCPTPTVSARELPSIEALEEALVECERRVADLESRNEQLSRFVEQLNDVIIAQDRRLLSLERELLGQRDGPAENGGIRPF